MSERIHVLAQQLFGKSSIDECDLQEIKNLADRYPYFAPAQFLLLEKLKKEKAPGYSAQLQKSVLYYHDPLEFEYFISSDRFETEVNFEESDQSSEVDFRQEDEIVSEIPIVPENETALRPEEDIHEEENEDTVSEEELSTADQQKMEASIERVLQQEEQQIDQPASNNDLVFEPYHTVDYFASQGIKLSQEETSKDKFGKQLKSFTEWLKTMKRLPAKEISKEIDPSTETKVQHLAEDSVHQSDVVTEAMAEVWIKQGNKEKAIETYNKLGLLNPSKKAYFAGLIENLKRS
ncbi:MAG TPA: hypothetical protein VNT20_07410 [Flavisolibacter sp.]|jgi:hypothetical protein|nr:hypothetical protein [Flavisolibacter sp.]